METSMNVKTLRPALSGLGAIASVATGACFVASDPAYAEEVTSAPKADDGTVEIPATMIEGQSEPSTSALKANTGLDRLPDTLQSTPQTVTVVPQVVIEQQQATTIDQVLKYVPGVIVATGEGNGGMNGDAFRIRGFDAKGDIYIDGLRDFGAYVRDDFATENVQVFKGSSSESFGNGTTGGAINLQSKTAHLGDSNTVQTTLGGGPQKRVVADVNHQLDGTTALRIVGMWHDQDVEGRDHVYTKRWGALGSLGFGVGTDQTFTINYMHQRGDRRPDMGVPIPTRTDGGRAYPVTEYGVPRSSFYGKESDRDVTKVDMLTLRYHKDIGDWLTLSNDTRYARYTRRMVFTPNVCMDGGGFYGLPTNTCTSSVLSGNLNTAYTVWPVYGDVQKSYGGENITTALARFNTGPLRHEMTGGFDVYYQRNKFGTISGSSNRDGGTLLDPIFDNPEGFTLSERDSGKTRAQSWDVGVFASDRVWLTDTFSVLAGLCEDSYHARSASWDTTTDGFAPWSDATTHFLSPKASLIWEPTPQQSYYISYARSFTPQGANPTYQGTVSQSEPNLEPDKNRTLEIGGKWSLLDDDLGLTAALFRVNKNRGSYNDPLTGASVAAGEDRVQGVELGVTGKITPAWDAQASYTYMDSKILASTPSTFDPGDTVGNHVPYVSRHNLALWSTYNIAPLFALPGKVLLGGGMNYRSAYDADPTMRYGIRSATTFDAMVSYEIDRYRVALNITNLTDKLTYSSAFYYRAEVAPGRTVALSTSVEF
ncbi:TonB-dependent siderophore receptor [Pseudomonas sp. C2L11]|nr:TonB-dependent siderophore receptor [Pseudomonas typographi]